MLFSSTRIARKNYISARLLTLKTSLQVLAYSEFNIKCLVAHISLLAKKTIATARMLAKKTTLLACSPVLTKTIRYPYQITTIITVSELAP